MNYVTFVDWVSAVRLAKKSPFLHQHYNVVLQDFIMGLFGKSKGADPKEQVDKEQIGFVCIIIYIWFQVNEWCKKLRKEERGLERQVADDN